MTTLPQLRVRSGYSYRNAYGRMPEIVTKLKELGVTSAGLVDHGTWGHVRFEQALKKAEMHPMFGMEVPIINPDNGFKPVAWVLATDTKKLYNFTSRVVRNGGATPEELAAAPGLIRFIGGALDLPEDAYDYIDVNPSSYLHAAKAVRLARQTGKPMVLTSYNDMPDKKHEPFAHAWEVRDSVGMRWIASEEEMWSVLQEVMSRDEFEEAGANTRAVAESLQGHILAKAPLIYLDGDLEALAREGQASRLARGHIAEWTQVYEERFKLELDQIKLKKFDSYFLVVSDLVRYAKEHMLVGPARGSSAGSLICYLIGITEVDPLPHQLLFHRFIDISRADLPDIDIDFTDTKRHLVFEYLQNKYGKDNVSKLGNINTLKAASVLAQVGKKFGIAVWETSNIRNSLIEYSSADERYGKGLEDTMTKTEPGKDFQLKWPKAAACMGDIEIHPSHSGVHAAGILVCNDPVTDYCTVTEDGVAQIDKPDSEYLNLLKIDALGLRTLGVIEDAGVITAEELYGLKLDDKSVLDILNEDKVSGIFQFEGDAVRSVTRSVNVDDFSKIDHLTALARPGPLSSGMAQRYIARAAGKEPITYDVPQLEKYLSNTYGVILYQEQIMSMVKELGSFDWQKTSTVRKAMSGRKGEEYFNKLGQDFVAGAVANGIPEAEAKKIWSEMATFGAWGFNKSHSVSYAIVTYWTCYLKRYFPLEYAAASLRAAKDDEQTIAILREISREGIEYTPIDPDFSDMNWKVADGRLIGGIQNAKGYGPVKALSYVQKREAGTLTQKDKDRLTNAEIKYADLAEAHTKWGHYYRDPALAGVTSGRPIMNMADCVDGVTSLVIAKLMSKTISDANEPIRVKKRGGKVYKGQTIFLDMFMVDDSSDSALRFRIGRDMYLSHGKAIAEGAPKGSWWLIKVKRLSEYQMFNVIGIKRLDGDVETA
jgi:DNA polymerase III alpha subunit